jgi:hypothetical protein
MLKLLLDGPLEEAAPPALKALLARSADAIDFAALTADMTAAATRVLGHFEALIEAPAAAARGRVAAQSTAPSETVQATTTRESTE